MLVNLRLDSSFSAVTFRMWSYGHAQRGRVYQPVIRADYGIQAHILSFADFLDRCLLPRCAGAGISLSAVQR